VAAAGRAPRGFRSARVVLEPLLLAVVRALAAGESLERAAARPVRIEPAPGVLVVPLRTPTLPPATHTNCVLVGRDEIAIIEPASPHAEEIDRVLALVDELAAEGRRVVGLLLTHHHVDHVGGAERLRAALGVPLCAHAETARRLSGRVSIDRTIAEGEEIFGLRALFTPGHAPGHLCYLDPRSRVLVAGDMVAGEGTILIAREDAGDMRLYLDSLARLAALDLHAVVPAHGPPSAEPRALFERYILHRRMREQRVLACLEAAGGSASAADLLPKVYDDTPRAAWPWAEISLDAHLGKLEAEGQIQEAGGVWQLLDRRSPTGAHVTTDTSPKRS
jgi:glyoxylase-like metal-dependent hydrolase (beta-lactamase superfamily II)